MRALLFPFSFLFRIIVFFRNKLYDYNFIKAVRLDSKVISVGNISTGGTGKTTFVEFIAKYLLRANKFVVVIVKAYKSEIDDMQIVEFGYKNEDHKLTSKNFSDEGILLLENLSEEKTGKGLLVVADNKRSGAKLADSKFKPDVIIIDDGFQHRNISRNLDLVILNVKYKGMLLPAGNFREPYSSIKRADVKILNYKFDDEYAIDFAKFGQFPRYKYFLDGFYNSKSERLKNINSLVPLGKVIAFCGIGDPDSFKSLLEVSKVDVAEFFVYPDHHDYTNADVQKILSSFKSSKAASIITTQKDFVRFKYSSETYKGGDNLFKELVYKTPFYFAKIQLEFTENKQALFERIDELIKEL